MPNNQWRRGDELTDAPIFPRQCDSRAPYNMRGTKYAPGGQHNPPRQAASYRATYDPRTGLAEGAVDAQGDPVRFVDQGDLSVLGGDSWKWLLVGPVAAQ